MIFTPTKTNGETRKPTSKKTMVAAKFPSTRRAPTSNKCSYNLYKQGYDPSYPFIFDHL